MNQDPTPTSEDTSTVQLRDSHTLVPMASLIQFLKMKHISSNPEALDAFTRSDLSYFGSFALSYVGGGAIGASFGKAQANDESVDRSLVGVGVALIGSGFFAQRSAQKHMTNGINLFNSALVSSNRNPSRFLNVISGVYVSDSQVGIWFSF